MTDRANKISVRSFKLFPWRDGSGATGQAALFTWLRGPLDFHFLVPPVASVQPLMLRFNVVL